MAAMMSHENQELAAISCKNKKSLFAILTALNIALFWVSTHS
jgi:hypothetical protein